MRERRDTTRVSFSCYLGFDIPQTNLINFIIRQFFSDMDKILPPFRFERINGLISCVPDTGKEERGQVVADMEILMKYVEKTEVLAFAWSVK